MRKRIGKTVVAVTLVGSMAVTPVFAAPAKENENRRKKVPCQISKVNWNR